jgi:hypothetical protein
MKEKLIQANVQEANKASLFELFDMYEAIVMNDSIGQTHSAKAVLVKYPLIPSSCIHDLKVLSSLISLKVVDSFKMKISLTKTGLVSFTWWQSW